MGSYKQLRQFKQEELAFTEQESIIILKFIFNQVDHALINSLQMSDHLRSFAQGLLVEAIDASYKIGYLQSLFKSTANPTAGAAQIIKRFAKNSAKHWFKHTNIHNLQNVEIYDFVRSRIAAAFRSELGIFLSSALFHIHGRPAGAYIAYDPPKQGIAVRWI